MGGIVRVRWLAALASIAIVVVAAVAPIATANHCSGCIDRRDIARGAVGSGEIVNGGVRTGDLATRARTQVKHAYNDGPEELLDAMTEVADLTLPPGWWTIFAKAEIDASTSGSPVVRCRLTAGGDVDRADVTLGADGSSGDPAQVVLNLVIRLGSPGEARFSCSDPGGEDATAQNVRLTALRAAVASLQDDG